MKKNARSITRRIDILVEREMPQPIVSGVVNGERSGRMEERLVLAQSVVSYV